MAASAAARSAPAVTTQPSKTRSTSVTYASVPGSPTDLSDAGFVIGTAASAPATYGALSNPVLMTLQTNDRVTIDSNAATISGTLIPTLSAMTVGQRVWLCYFATVTGIGSSSVPDAVYDLGLLLA